VDITTLKLVRLDPPLQNTCGVTELFLPDDKITVTGKTTQDAALLSAMIEKFTSMLKDAAGLETADRVRGIPTPPATLGAI
jgi:hypothetical protein